MQKIIQAIAEAEKHTSGEIRVHVRRFCGKDPLSEAKKIFHKLKMDQTAKRNGVLIFVALSSHRFSIYGDRGIHEKVGDAFWNETRDKIQSYFAQGQIEEGIAAGVQSAGMALKAHFPCGDDDKNELSNEVTQD